MIHDEIDQLCRSLGIPATYSADRRLARQIEASEAQLVKIAPVSDGRSLRLEQTAARAWSAMHAAAATDGIFLLPLSGFRSIARQAEIIRAKLAAGRPLSEILHVNAAPGYSEHHTGRALDLGTPGNPPFEESFAQTAAFAWLTHRASSFGFALSFPRENPHGIAFEPWHWCWQSDRPAAFAF